MGSSPSKDTKVSKDLQEMKARKYPELFYKAIEAAQAGRYMVSEAYFHQVIEAHPAFDMYNGMLNEIGSSLLSLETGRGYTVAEEKKGFRLNSQKRGKSSTRTTRGEGVSVMSDAVSKEAASLSDGETDTLIAVNDDEDDLPNREVGAQDSDDDADSTADVAELKLADSPLTMPQTNHRASIHEEAGRAAHLSTLANSNEDGQSRVPPSVAGTVNPQSSTGSNSDRFEVPFYLDHQGEVIVGYHKMLQDIEYVYLSCGTAKAHQLAMVYAQRNCVGFQVTLYCVNDMTQERRRRERQGKGDRNRILDKDMADVIFAEATKGRNANKYAKEDDLEVIIHQLCQSCRYFWISSATNYGHLALQFAESMDTDITIEETAPSRTNKTQKEQDREKERRKRGKHRILVNVMENCEAIVELIREMANEAPTEYVNMVVLKVLPDVRKMRLERRRREVEESRVVSRATQSTDAASKVSGGASSKYGSSSNDQVNAEMLKARYAMLGIQKGSQSAISDSRNFTPALPILLPLDRIRLPMRLVPTVDQSNGPALKSDLANITQPVERNCWQYNGWTIGEEGKQIIIYPAATHFLLAKALPQYYQADTTGYVKFHKTPIPGQSPPTSAYVDMLLDYVEKAKPQAELVKMAKTATTERHKEEELRPNRNLSLYDPQMRATVLTDEVAVCALPLYLLLGKVYKALGMAEESRLMARAVTLQTACFHGPDSSERWFMQDVVRREGLV